MPSLDKWIISILLTALSAVLWYLLLDTRQELVVMRTQMSDHVSANASRLATLDTKVESALDDIKDLKRRQH